jgi:DNA primase
MPASTPYAAGFLFAQIVATMVANKHPTQATIERSLKARGRRIYVDYMQNALGKTLASAYSARASEFAGVSTPIAQGFHHPQLRGAAHARGRSVGGTEKVKGRRSQHLETGHGATETRS